MIKWNECEENGVLYEAFLPEHEQEACVWLLRASRRGHILAERQFSLTWPPRFGPDVGDVAALEAAADALITALAPTVAPAGDGGYTPLPSPMSAPEPILHAMLHALIEQYSDAERVLGLTAAQTAAYLELPVVASAQGLYPFAVTRPRDGKMNRLIALASVIQARPEVRPHQQALLSALLAGDIPQLKATLIAAGVTFEGPWRASLTPPR